MKIERVAEVFLADNGIQYQHDSNGMWHYQADEKIKVKIFAADLEAAYQKLKDQEKEKANG